MFTSQMLIKSLGIEEKPSYTKLMVQCIGVDPMGRSPLKMVAIVYDVGYRL